MVSPELLRALAALESKEGSFPPGSCLFKEGEPLDAVWVLKQGTLGVHTSRYNKENPLHPIASRKRLWGVREMISGMPMQCTGIAETEIKGYSIPMTVFRRAMTENANLRLMIMQAMAKELSLIPLSVVE